MLEDCESCYENNASRYIARVMGMFRLIIPNYQVVPSTVSTSRQDVVAVSYDPLLHWVSDVMEGIPVIGVTIVTT